MEMCYNETLVMPSSFVVMSEEEMTYVDGGVSLPMKKSYLNKSTCKSVGAKYTASTGLSKMRIAKEVYAHAVMYYASTAALIRYGVTLAAALGVVGATVDTCLMWIRKHANPVDIGGDSAFRVKVYNKIWDIL